MSRGGYYKTSNDIMHARPPMPVSNLLREPYIKEEPKPGPVKVEMKWETLQYANSGDPQVWGPAFWFTLHNGAARYPERASPLFAERMKGFILGMPVMIPCEKCADHATAHIEANWRRLDEIVSGRRELFNFFNSFHNYVNRRYNKPEMSAEDAYALYTGRTNVTKLTYGNSCPHDK
jgi:hypothetical protein